jgi:glycosyltransferase involved in cell wall biosynthesis
MHPIFQDVDGEVSWETTAWSWASEDSVILSVGRLEAYKRLDRVIAALPYLPQRCRLVVVGPGPEETPLKRLAAGMGVSGRVLFRGYVADGELQRWYRRAAVVVSLSEGEAFGRVILEALVAERHVVCSDIMAFRDFAAEFPSAVSLVAARDDPKTVAATLGRAIGRPQPSVDLRRYEAPNILCELERAYEECCVRTACSHRAS